MGNLIGMYNNQSVLLAYQGPYRSRNDTRRLFADVSIEKRERGRDREKGEVDDSPRPPSLDRYLPEVNRKVAVFW